MRTEFAGEVLVREAIHSEPWAVLPVVELGYEELSDLRLEVEFLRREPSGNEPDAAVRSGGVAARP